MYYANCSNLDKKAQKILKAALKYKVIKDESEVNTILCANVFADTSNCALCTDKTVIIGQRKLGVLYFADVYNYSVITSVAHHGGVLSFVLGGGQTVEIKIAADTKDFNSFVDYVLGKIRSDSTTTLSPADEIKKYKELLDMGAITESEFVAKKKELLKL